MKARNKFIVAQIDIHIDDFAKMSNKNSYRENAGIGIISNVLDSSGFSATFVEKRKLSENIKLPNGEIQVVERIKYVYVEFKVIPMHESYYILRITNPPISLKSFVNYLSKIFTDLSIEKYEFNLKKFHDAIKNNDKIKSCRVISLKASSVPFGEKSMAKLEIFSEKDSYRELKKQYGEKSYKLDRLVFSLSSERASSTIAVSSNGTIYFDSDNHEESITESFVKSISF